MGVAEHMHTIIVNSIKYKFETISYVHLLKLNDTSDDSDTRNQA